MSEYSRFRIEDDDIVRLERPDSDSDNLSRAGWVNVGAFAVHIMLDAAGDLVMLAYPCGNEQTALASVFVRKDAAMAAGATDCDAE